MGEEIALLAFLLSMGFSFLLGIAAAFLGQGLHPFSSEITLLFSLFLGIFLAKKLAQRLRADEIEASSFLSFEERQNKKFFSSLSFWEWATLFSFCWAIFRSFFWLLYQDGDALKILSPHNLGDLSWHITLIHYLAQVKHWWPANPILMGEPLRYQIGTDFINALLSSIGIPLQQGLLWIGLLGATATAIALWRWGGAFAMATLLFTGGLGMDQFLPLWHGSALFPLEEQLVWKNFFLTLFVTQRSFLFSLPTGLWLLSRWRLVFKKDQIEFLKDREKRKKEKSAQIVNESLWSLLLLEALLLGLLPAFSAHTFLFLLIILATLFLFTKERNGKRHFLIVTVLGGIEGFFVTRLIAPHEVCSHLIGWQLGWMQTGTSFGEILHFWINNFGIALAMIFLLGVLICKKEKKREKEIIRKVAAPFVLASLFLLLSCFLIRWAPWSWDNTKLMIWSWLVTAPFLWELMLCPLAIWLRVPLLILLFIGGATTLFMELSGAPNAREQGYTLASEKELRQVDSLVKNLRKSQGKLVPPSNLLIATAPTYNHPLLLLGYPIAVGYEGHLWSHGLDYKERLQKLRAIMMGAPGWREMAQELGITAIFWAKEEQEAFPDSELPLAHHGQDSGGEIKPELLPIKI